MQMRNFKQKLCFFAFVSFCFALYPATSVARPPFDLDNGNAAVEIVIPSVIPVIAQDVSPSGGDATLVLRYTTVITNSWFDAIAPYHPTAVGVYSRLGRRPPGERTNRNRNIAIIYSSYRVLNSLTPIHFPKWRKMVEDAGLDPDDNQTNLTNAIGIGNRAGSAVAAVREQDGMNQLGNEGGRAFNRQPYADYLGYKPVNTAYTLLFPSRWQPNVVTNGGGIFQVQQFVTPQMRVVLPYSYDNPNVFRAPFPSESQIFNFLAYKRQADEVLAVSANLTDEQKIIAEIFNDKIRSLGFSALFASQSNNLTLEQFVHYDFLTNAAAFDTAIAVWNEKHRYDVVRPFSAIRFLYGDRLVRAWGGPGKGTVNIPASEWRSYLNTADHPEYPSGSAAFCGAHAQASRLYFGSDNLGWSIPTPQGSSLVEPDVTPAADIVINFATWSELEEECGLSRLWGGVHFTPSLPAGRNIGRAVGSAAFQFVQSHLNGTPQVRNHPRAPSFP
jgi:hypothetical protein